MLDCVWYMIRLFLPKLTNLPQLLISEAPKEYPKESPKKPPKKKGITLLYLNAKSTQIALIENSEDKNRQFI